MAVKVLEGNLGKRCLSGSEPKPQKKAPRCPSCLEDEAKKEWKRIVFDEAKAQRTVDFTSCLKHTKGRWRGQNFELLPWQDSIIRDVFGTVKENGHRQYNTAYVEIPKKNGKSELAAGVALNMTCGDGEWERRFTAVLPTGIRCALSSTRKRRISSLGGRLTTLSIR